MEATIRAINEGHIHQYLTKPWNDVELRALVETTLHTHLLEFNNRQLKQELMLKNRQIDELKHLLKQKEGES